MANLRAVVVLTFPVITALFGLLWYFGRRKAPPDKQEDETSLKTLVQSGSETKISQNHRITSDVAKSRNQPSTSDTNTSQNQPDVSEGALSQNQNHPNTPVAVAYQNQPGTLDRKTTQDLSLDGKKIYVNESNSTAASAAVVEEIVCAEKSTLVASSSKHLEENYNCNSRVHAFSQGETRESGNYVNDDIAADSASSVEKVLGNSNLLKNDFKQKEYDDKTSNITADIENFRDSLNLEDDFDYRSYSKDESMKDDTHAGFNEAFIDSVSLSESRVDSKSEIVNEIIERTTIGNTSISALHVSDVDSSEMGQPLLESSTLAPSVLESSVVGQPLLESTSLDTTSSAFSKDIDNQPLDSEQSNASVSHISELNLTCSESNTSWAEISRGCENEPSPTCKDAELRVSVSEDALSAADSSSNCSKTDNRHIKDFSPEIQHRSGNNDTDNGVSSESNCDSASVDSGKGASIHEVLSTASQDVPHKTNNAIQTYQCNFPTSICGRLIGRAGKNINLIKDRSGANISLNTNPYTPDYQLCSIEGTKKQIDDALRQITHKFPDIDLSPVNTGMPLSSNGGSPPAHPVLMPEIMQVMPEDMQLNIPEGVSVDVVVSSIVDAGHIFVQQHTHPSFPSLERLNQFMMACYTTDGIVPQLPRPIEVGVICAAPMLNGWYRAQISCVYEDTDECDIKFVDYGGFSRVQACVLRQIRSDFMTLPFQATECYMANVTPLQDEEYFSPEASATLEMLTQGKLLQAQVVGRTEDGIPYVHVYQISGDNNVIFVNRELVNRGLTRWIEVLS